MQGRLVDGRGAERRIAVAMVLGELHQIDEVTAQFRKGGFCPSGGRLQATLASQESPAHEDHQHGCDCQPGGRDDGQRRLREPHDGVGIRARQEHSQR